MVVFCYVHLSAADFCCSETFGLKWIAHSVQALMKANFDCGIFVRRALVLNIGFAYWYWRCLMLANITQKIS